MTTDAEIIAEARVLLRGGYFNGDIASTISRLLALAERAVNPPRSDLPPLADDGKAVLPEGYEAPLDPRATRLLAWMDQSSDLLMRATALEAERDRMREALTKWARAQLELEDGAGRMTLSPRMIALQQVVNEAHAEVWAIARAALPQEEPKR